MQCANIRVYGVVQGVGFCHMVRNKAHHLRITGYVKNLEDASVEIKCEGKKENIAELVEIIRKSKDPVYVDNMDVKYFEGDGEFNTFQIIVGDLASEMMEGFDTYCMYLEQLNSK